MSFLLDESTHPGTSMDVMNKCIPGDKLFPTTSAAKNYQAGNGCFEFKDAIYASLIGSVFIINEMNSVINRNKKRQILLVN